MHTATASAFVDFHCLTGLTPIQTETNICIISLLVILHVHLMHSGILCAIVAHLVSAVQHWATVDFLVSLQVMLGSQLDRTLITSMDLHIQTMRPLVFGEEALTGK